MILNLYKKAGETPLERIKRFKDKHPEYQKLKMTYAGRLDPLAEGVLLILEGEEVNNKEEYLALDKEYSFNVIFGVETDTYDVLGRIVLGKWKYKKDNHIEPATKNIKSALSKFEGKIIQQYPPYSSKTVRGKALFDWAKEGTIGEIEIPKREIEIHSLKFLGKKKVSKKTFRKHVLDSISKVTGNFRQEEIKKSWESYFQDSFRNEFILHSFTLSCGSGTYVRSLAHELGKTSATTAIADGIIRLKIGEYSIKDALC